MDPWSQSAGAGYQLIQALYALGSGGILGAGAPGRVDGGGDRTGAHQHFELAVQAREPYQSSYAPSRAFLKRMDEDRSWPPWIK